MGWEYVGLLYVSNNYGTKGARAFQRAAYDRGVCVASPVAISVNPTNVDEKHLYDAFVALMQQNVKVGSGHLDIYLSRGQDLCFSVYGLMCLVDC